MGKYVFRMFPRVIESSIWLCSLSDLNQRQRKHLDWYWVDDSTNRVSAGEA